MSSNVAVVDYGSGNLLSVQRALEHVGARVCLAADPDTVLGADRLVLPGVGAFADGLEGLRRAGLVEPILEFARSGRPLLGICLGMQMLASRSEEFGDHAGLDIIPGRVVRIPATTVAGEPLKTPHIGWADLSLAPGRTTASAFGVSSGDSVYLVHSFHFEPAREAHRLADCDYGGRRITAAVQAGNVLGFQFHPEKSGAVGLRMLNAYMKQ